MLRCFQSECLWFFLERRVGTFLHARMSYNYYWKFVAKFEMINSTFREIIRWGGKRVNAHVDIFPPILNTFTPSLNLILCCIMQIKLGKTHISHEVSRFSCGSNNWCNNRMLWVGVLSFLLGEIYTSFTHYLLAHWSVMYNSNVLSLCKWEVQKHDMTNRSYHQ